MLIEFWNKDNGLKDIIVTTELVMMLKKNYISEHESFKILWNSIFRKCMGYEYCQLMWTKAKEINKLKESIKNTDKFKNILNSNRYAKGYSYRDLAKQPIIIPPHSSDQLKKLFINIGSLNSVNTNPDMVTMTSALLDELYKNQKISKPLYKALYYKAKYLHENNLKDSLVIYYIYYTIIYIIITESMRMK